MKNLLIILFLLLGGFVSVGLFLPNEIHVDPGEFALYWTQPGEMAIRSKSTGAA